MLPCVASGATSSEYSPTVLGEGDLLQVPDPCSFILMEVEMQNAGFISLYLWALDHTVSVVYIEIIVLDLGT